MKKITLLILSLILLTSGCSPDFSKKELSDIDLINLMAIDYYDNNIVLTGIYNSYLDDNSIKLRTITGKGKTMFLAFENLKKNNNKNISIAHTSFYLIGEEAAYLGLNQYLDYLLREETVKMNSLILITKDKSAKDFISKNLGEELDNFKNLESINQKEKEKIKIFNNKISVLFNNIYDNKPFVIPYVISKDNEFIIEGLSLFKDLKLYDYFSYNMSQAYNLLNNNLKKMPILLPNKVGIILTNPKVKFKYSINSDNDLFITIDIKSEAIIKEALELNEKTLYLEEIYLKGLCENLLNYSILEGLDIFNINNESFTYKINIKTKIKESYVY